MQLDSRPLFRHTGHLFGHMLCSCLAAHMSRDRPALLPYSPVITPWTYRKETLFSGRILGHGCYFGPRRIDGPQMLSFIYIWSQGLYLFKAVGFNFI